MLNGCMSRPPLSGNGGSQDRIHVPQISGKWVLFTQQSPARNTHKNRPVLTLHTDFEECFHREGTCIYTRTINYTEWGSGRGKCVIVHCPQYIHGDLFLYLHDISILSVLYPRSRFMRRIIISLVWLCNCVKYDSYET